MFHSTFSHLKHHTQNSQSIRNGFSVVDAPQTRPVTNNVHLEFEKKKYW